MFYITITGFWSVPSWNSLIPSFTTYPFQTSPGVTARAATRMTRWALTTIPLLIVSVVLLCNYRKECVIPRKDYLCPICLEAPHNPVSTLCGHIFCEKCIRRMFKVCSVRFDLMAVELPWMEVSAMSSSTNSGRLPSDISSLMLFSFIMYFAFDMFVNQITAVWIESLTIPLLFYSLTDLLCLSLYHSTNMNTNPSEESLKKQSCLRFPCPWNV